MKAVEKKTPTPKQSDNEIYKLMDLPFLTLQLKTPH